MTKKLEDLFELPQEDIESLARPIPENAQLITAKTAKINKKLKMLDLQLKKAALDHKTLDKNEEVQATPLGEGHTLDRNELLKMLSKKPQE